MNKRRRRYSAEFKEEALALYEASDKTLAEVEEELGISPGLLRRWRMRVLADGADAFPGNGRLKPEDEELRRLRRENEVLRQERDILKKAIAIFSEKRPRSIGS
jgi:transposase